MQLGRFVISNRVWLAPMAGVTDRAFRQMCRSLGAGMAVSEMVSADAQLRGTAKTRRRIDNTGESRPRSVQIAGAHPAIMAEAARYNVQLGADVIDINMGCPAKKVCGARAGSALLNNERLVAQIVASVVDAVEVPVTLKIRTGYDRANRNGVRIARIAEEAGVAAIAVHGRTRACGYRGAAEYETIRAIKTEVGIPIIANGDIDGPERAQFVLSYTGADGLMVGRAAQGNPWLFREIDHYLRTGRKLPPPETREVRNTLLFHLHELYGLYGERQGVRIARKHLSWYVRGRPGAAEFWHRVNRVESADPQLALTRAYFDKLSNKLDLAA